MSDQTELLEALMAHPAYHLWCDIARREWAEKERAGRKNALGDTDDKRALDKLRQITAAQEAVEWTLDLPRQELGRLKRQEMESASSDSSLTSRASTPFAFGMSRRGTL